MYIRTKFFFPATIRWRGIFFGTLLALVSRRKGIKRWRKVFRDTRSDFLPLLRGSVVQGAES